MSPPEGGRHNEKKTDKTLDFESLVMGNKCLSQSITVIANELFSKEE